MLRLLSVLSGPAAPTDSISSTSAPPATVQHTVTQQAPYPAEHLAPAAHEDNALKQHCHTKMEAQPSFRLTVRTAKTLQRTLFLMQWCLNHQDKECYYNPCYSCGGAQAAKNEAANRRPCPKTANHSATAFLWHPMASRMHPGDPAPLPQGSWALAQPQNYLHTSGFLQMQALFLLPRRSDPFGFTVSKTAPCLASFPCIPGRSTHFIFSLTASILKTT